MRPRWKLFPIFKDPVEKLSIRVAEVVRGRGWPPLALIKTEQGFSDRVAPAREMEGRHSGPVGKFPILNTAGQLIRRRGSPHAIVGVRHRGGVIHTGQVELARNMLAHPTEGLAEGP